MFGEFVESSMARQTETIYTTEYLQLITILATAWKEWIHQTFPYGILACTMEIENNVKVAL